MKRVAWLVLRGLVTGEAVGFQVLSTTAPGEPRLECRVLRSARLRMGEELLLAARLSRHPDLGRVQYWLRMLLGRMDWLAGLREHGWVLRGLLQRLSLRSWRLEEGVALRTHVGWICAHVWRWNVDLPELLLP